METTILSLITDALENGTVLHEVAEIALPAAQRALTVPKVVVDKAAAFLGIPASSAEAFAAEFTAGALSIIEKYLPAVAE